ncbi:MAG: head GIN domain-containing protein [Anaerolineales bacterium]|jgi:hypothetical protein
MNRRTTLTILGVILAMVMMACNLSGILVENNGIPVERGSGNVVEESRVITGVTGVDLATIGSVIIEIGDKESLRIEAEDNLMKYFETSVRGGVLKIDTDPLSINLKPTKPVYFFLTVENLDLASISGSGDIQVPDLKSNKFNASIGGSGDINMGNLNGDQLEVEIGGSGDVSTGRVKITSLRVSINGSGDITLSELVADDLSMNVNGSGSLRINGGSVNMQDIDVNGSGNLQAEDLSSKVSRIKIGGSGNINIWVIDTLDARITGSGNIRYYGRPAVSSSGNGSGDVISLGDK